MKKIMLCCFISLLLSSCVCSRKESDDNGNGDKGEVGIALPQKIDTNNLNRPTIKVVEDTSKFMKVKAIRPATLDTVSVH